MQFNPWRPYKTNTRCGHASMRKKLSQPLKSWVLRLVAFSPLGRGFLTGKMDENTRFAEGDIRNSLPRYTEEAIAANQALIDLVQKFADSRQATPAQIALAWILAQKPWIVPIPGTTKLHRLTENNGAVSIQLTSEELKEIELATAEIDIVGTRYNEQMERSTGL